jgi:hypothetical protein
MVLFRHDLLNHIFFGVCMGSEGTELFNRKLNMSVRPLSSIRCTRINFTCHEEHSTGSKLCMTRLQLSAIKMY